MTKPSVLHNVPLPPAQVIGVAGVVVLERIRSAPMSGPLMLRRVVAAAMIAAGGALNVWALVERRRRTTGRFDLAQPGSLVTTGPYGFSRHPMYVGWWLVHLGFGVLRGSNWVFVTLAVATLAEHAGVVAEESALEQEFPDEFVRYRERVPRYLRMRLRPHEPRRRVR